MRLSPAVRNHFREADTGANATTGSATIDVVKERGDAVTSERKRVADIQELNKHFLDKGIAGRRVNATSLAERMIADGKTVEDFQREVIRTELPEIKPVDTTAGIGMDEKDVKRFSFVGAIRAMAMKGKLEGYEAEVCGAAQRQMRRELKNERTFVLPDEVSRHFDGITLQRQLATRAASAGVFSAGGALVQSQYGPMIEFLRNTTALGKLGITILDGLVGDFVMPVQTGGCTAYWVTETGSITDSQATFAQKAMTPHRVGASYPFTMQLLAQSSLSVDAFVMNELNTVLALKKDLSGFIGTGTSGEPLGIANTVGINATVTYGGAAVWADVVEHETGIAVDNADIGSMGFALSSATVGKWKTILKDSVAGAGYLLSEGMTANGYPVVRTNQIATANQSFFGVWSQFIMGVWAGREVTIDSITLAKSGQHQVIINELCDNLVRQPLAFNVSTDSAAQ